VAVIHGDLTQAQRERALENFRRGRVRFLVATDVASRGLDIEGITHVVNYEVPSDPLLYFHRIGRTGRAGASGVAVTLVSRHEMLDLKRIQSMTNTHMHQLPQMDVRPGEPSRDHRSVPWTQTPRWKPTLNRGAVNLRG